MMRSKRVVNVVVVVAVVVFRVFRQVPTKNTPEEEATATTR